MPTSLAAQLDRTSFVPLYYQLQEVLKEQIESGVWRPGDRLPSEPQLARSLGVSRAVVRQSLAILEDDHQIIRVRGRGTFVSQPKLTHRAGGLVRILRTPRQPEISIQVLDKRLAAAGKSIRSSLQVGDHDELLRLTTMLSLSGVPLAITYSFFRRSEVGWLEEVAHVGRSLPPDLVLHHHGLELAHSQVSIEASQCGQFEADRFKIPHRSAVFLVFCTEHRCVPGGSQPFEAARVEYRGDLLKFQLELAPSESGALAVTWVLSDRAAALLGQPDSTLTGAGHQC